MKPYYEEPNITIYCGDCLEIMKKIPNKSVDLVITSPPYENISGAGYKAETKDVLFLKLYSDFIDKIFEQYERVLKNNGQIFFNLKTRTHKQTLRTPHWLEFTDGFQRFKLKSYIIWKYAGSFDSSYKRFHLDYEIFYHLSLGDNIFLNANCDKDPLSSVWYIPHYIPKEERLHPVQMPKDVVRHILKIASKEKDIVMDNFMGSGTTLVACKESGRKGIGIEINKEYCNIAVARLKATMANLL